MEIVKILWSMVPGGVTAAALVFLLRGWITQRLKQSIKSEYDRKLEDHKAELTRANDVHLVELNAKYENAKQVLEHNLELARLEHQTKFAGSYQEVLKAIKDVHAMLIEIQKGMNAYTSIFENSAGPSKEDRRKQVAFLVEEFWKLYNPQRIFFTEALDGEIVQYVHDVSKKGIDFMLQVEKQEMSAQTEGHWTRINEEVQGQWNTVLASIRGRFRSILGVDDEQT